MQKYSGHIPDAPRQLPAALYGQFDIRTTPDGGRQYSLPHTLGASVIARTTQPRMMLAIGVIAAAWPIIFPERDAGAPLASNWIYIPLMFLLLHGIVAFAVAIAALITGTRKITRITIREDGLILDDATFYAAAHLWMIGYGVTTNEGKPDEVFAPKITIQVGTNVITLADGLEVEPAKLFMRLFGEDTRRYWHRHN